MKDGLEKLRVWSIIKWKNRKQVGVSVWACITNGKHGFPKYQWNEMRKGKAEGLKYDVFKLFAECSMCGKNIFS